MNNLIKVTMSLTVTNLQAESFCENCDFNDPNDTFPVLFQAITDNESLLAVESLKISEVYNSA